MALQADLVTNGAVNNVLIEGVIDDLILLDVWKGVYRSNKIEVLQSAKTLKNNNLIFNGKFDIINNPGCII